ncbi:TPA: hypothetical protein EYP38_01320 [Candidatus Micrarchaeota archaeon]|nr:hypothetical protein [Candidatus Micrarchaeota archaeon]
MSRDDFKKRPSSSPTQVENLTPKKGFRGKSVSPALPEAQTDSLAFQTTVRMGDGQSRSRISTKIFGIAQSLLDKGMER